MISETPLPHQATQIPDSPSVCEKDPHLVASETTNDLVVDGNISEMRRDTEYYLTQFYPFGLFYERKESFDRKMAEQKEKWQQEKEELRALKTGVSKKSQLPEEKHEITTFFPR